MILRWLAALVLADLLTVGVAALFVLGHIEALWAVPIMLVAAGIYLVRTGGES